MIIVIWPERREYFKVRANMAGIETGIESCHTTKMVEEFSSPPPPSVPVIPRAVVLTYCAHKGIEYRSVAPAPHPAPRRFKLDFLC